MVKLIDRNTLSNKLSPLNYNNSPLNYKNSNSNYDNSIANYDNSSTNYNNMPSNFDNSFGKNRLYSQNNIIVGYAVYSPIGTLNIFSVSGIRVGYVPANNNTQSIFSSENFIWCGTLNIINGINVVELTEPCYLTLLSDK